MPEFTFRPLLPCDHDMIKRVIVKEWGAEAVVAHGDIFRPADLPGFAAFIGTRLVGLLTYNIKGNELEIVTLNSWHKGIGLGTALVDVVRQTANQAGCRRLFLVTTNNNTHALHFYQKRGFVISGVRINAMAKSRKLKHQIPIMDEDGLPIRDEIELEFLTR